MSPTLDVGSLLDAAIVSHEARDLDCAESLYLDVLRAEPDNVEALNLLGLVRQDLGQPDDAVALISRAIEIDPDFADAHANLARGLCLLDRPEEAANAARRAAQLDPDLGEAWLQLGRALFDLGRDEDALDALRRAAVQFPDSNEVYAAIGFAAQRSGRHADAVAAWHKVLELRPDRIDAMINLGAAHIQLNQLDDALAVHLRAAALAPDEFSALAALAATLHRRYDAEEVVPACRAALALVPDSADILTMLGSGLLWLGRFEEAAASCEAALAADPEFVPARQLLAVLRPDTLDTATIARFHEQLGDQGLSLQDRASAGFSIANALDKAGDFDNAFRMYQAANKIYLDDARDSGTEFNPDDFRIYGDWVRATFTPSSFAEMREAGNPSELPVFIVGMPRSGTTLVEQIAASHPQVFGAGERKDIAAMIARMNPGGGNIPIRHWERERLRHETEQHIAHLKALGGDTIRVIDKMPDNVKVLGQIRVLFPNARIIVCQRDPRDVCVSCFTTHFGGSINWSLDIEDCARQAVGIDLLLDRWRAVLPGPVLEISYEALVANFETESRRLIEFLGLEWDPACLTFHETRRIVTTASALQVRRPLYRSSIAKWRRYEAHLGPMLNLLAGHIPDQFISRRWDQPDAAGLNPTPPVVESGSHIGRPHVLLERAFKADHDGQHEEAIRLYNQVLKIDPTNVDALNCLGAAAGTRGNLLVAMKHFGDSLRIDPTQPEAWFNFAVGQSKLGMTEEALASLDRMIALSPLSSTGHLERATMLARLGRYQEALTAYDETVRLLPDDSVTAKQRGLAMQWCGLYEQAFREFDRALALNPNHAEAWLSKSMLMMLLGDLPNGLPLYEWRWSIDAWLESPRRLKREYTRPLWLGETSIAGKTILIYPEQGYGDVFQFCRYVTLAVDAGARVIVEAEPGLMGLMATLRGVSLVTSDLEPLPDHDLRCPMMSLPLAFGTTMETIPAEVPYLRADPARAGDWRIRLSGLRGRRIGLVWGAGSRIGDAEMVAIEHRKSMPLQALASLAPIAGCEFVSIQVGPAAAQATDPPPGMNLRDFSADLKDFGETAALMDNLDLVISVCTSTAHLAGALGKPVWLLNRFDTDWRWFLDREDSPWYPTMRIFRQPQSGDWDSVAHSVARALREFVGA